MRRAIVAIALFLALGACAGDAATRAVTTVAGACGALGRLLPTIAAFNSAGRLSANEIKSVDGAVKVSNKFCLPGAKILNPKQALALVDAELTRMIIMRGKHGG